MLGLLANVFAIAVGGTLGGLLKKGIPEKYSDTIIKALSICCFFIGGTGMLKGTNALMLLISMSVGAIIGTALDLDGRLIRAADRIGEKIKGKNENSTFSKAFVTATLIYCVGAMAVVAPMQAGLTGDNTLLFTKAVLDGISAVAFASALGMGVVLSCICVFLYQGAILLLAQYVAPYLTDYAVGEMTCTGSLLILVMAFNLLGMTEIKVMNFLPAMFIPLILCNFM